MNTPYFRARLNSMLRFIALKGKIPTHSILDEEVDICRKLVFDGKLGGYPDLFVLDSTPYGNDNTNDSETVNPVVFFLASENPANEEFCRVYRKNWYVPALPDLTTDVELVE